MPFFTATRTSSCPPLRPKISLSSDENASYTALPPYIIRRVYVSNGGYTYSSGGNRSFSSSKGPSVGAIVGIVVGVLVVSAVIAKQLSYRLRHGRWYWPWGKKVKSPDNDKASKKKDIEMQPVNQPPVVQPDPNPPPEAVQNPAIGSVHGSNGGTPAGSVTFMHGPSERGGPFMAGALNGTQVTGGNAGSTGGRQNAT